jgi:predicted DNA-binding ribbon-helix-helix protein
LDAEGQIRGLMMRELIVLRNVTVRGRRTSMRLHAEIWAAFDEICRRERGTLNQLCSEVDRERGEMTLTDAMRIHALSYFRAATAAAEAVGDVGEPASGRTVVERFGPLGQDRFS